MKKLFIILYLLFVIIAASFAQVIKTGESGSSIFLENTNIGIDIGKSELSFTSNNFTSNPAVMNKAILWGVTATGKNNEGLANIFETGKLTPTSSLTGVLGYTFSNTDKLKNYDKDNSDIILKKLSIEEKKLYFLLKASFAKDIDSMIADTSIVKMDLTQQKILSDKIKLCLSIETNKYKSIIKLLNEIADNPFEEARIRYKSKEILKNIEDAGKIKRIMEIEKEMDEANNAIFDFLAKRKYTYQKWNIFGHFGLTASKFTLFTGWDTVELSNSFKAMYFTGFKGGFGINYRYGGNWLFGLKYTYEESNNLSLLTSTEYEFSQTISSNNQSFTKKSKKTAYSGEYGKVFLNKVDIDVLRFIKLNEESMLLLDVYLRVTESNNDKLFATKSDIGVSSSFFKSNGKFLGGIYLELPDIDQNIERQKENPKYNNWYQRLSFGVYATFSFSSLINLN